MIYLLDPKLDYIFKNIVGVKKNKPVLLSFLKNTTLMDKKFIDVKEVQTAMNAPKYISADDEIRHIAYLRQKTIDHNRGITIALQDRIQEGLAEVKKKTARKMLLRKISMT